MSKKRKRYAVYTCADCGERFKSDRPDDDAVNEALVEFSAEVAARVPFAVVCEVCYQRVMSKVPHQ